MLRIAPKPLVNLADTPKAYGWIKKQWTEEQKAYMKWGSDHEDTAVNLFLEHAKDFYILEAPLTYHTNGKDASSPDGTFVQIRDGRVKDFGCVEVKCPAKVSSALQVSHDFNLADSS